jgi:transcriptional regulator with XRE-family HTH domain
VNTKTASPIRAARTRAELTQVQLALCSDLSLTTIRNAERGIATRRTLRAIARVLGVSVDDLTGRKAAAP